MDDSTLAYSLPRIERGVAYAIAQGATVIYYHHGLQQFRHFRGLSVDNDAFRQEVVNLKKNINRGVISAISAGEPITINGTDLFPVDLMFDDQPCYPYMLLRRNGLIDDADNTPYFFTSKGKCDQVIKCLNKCLAKKKTRKSMPPRGEK